MMKFVIIISTFTIFLSCSNKIENHQANGTNINSNNKVRPNMDSINTDKFWQIVDNAARLSNDNNITKQEILVKELTKLSLNEIIAFEFAFRKCIIDADDFKIMAAMKIIDGSVTDDSYLYFRCWLVGQGKTVFQETLKNPDYLANVVEDNKIHEFESLMYVTTEAYEIKTGKKEGDDFPRDVAYKAGLDYDFGAPPTKGTDWTEDDLPDLLPKLYKKFN